MIRDYEPRDLPAIESLHAEQGFCYHVPDFGNPLFMVKKVREVSGRVVGAMFLRLTAETFLVTAGSPVEKGRSVIELQPEVLREAYEKGLADVVCVIPPEILESFAPVLERMGWQRDRDWPMFSRGVELEECGQSGK
jgi:hypothetical protein